MANPLSADSSLEEHIIYSRAESSFPNSALEGTMSLKLNFPSVSELLRFAGDDWTGSQKEQKWIGDQIYRSDSNVDKTKPILLKHLRYKDSIFDDNPVVVIVAKYIQEQ